MFNLNATDMSRFEGFKIITKTYKIVQDHQIQLDVLIPKSISTESFANGRGAPVLLRYHGGGFCAGSSLFPPFLPPWLLRFAECHSAIIVSPNYRFIPESTVQDSVGDANDAFLWTRNSLQAELAADITFPVDVSRVLAVGDSAGGYLAVMVALEHPHAIRSVIAAYPLIDAHCPHLTGGYAKEVLGLPLVSPQLVPDHLTQVEAEKGRVIVSADPEARRIPLMMGLVQYGLLGQMFPADQRKLFPLLRLDDGDRFPRGGLVVLHGKKDSIVPISGSVMLQKKLQDLDPELDFRLLAREGEHGFDHQLDINEDGGFEEALDGVTKAWII